MAYIGVNTSTTFVIIHIFSKGNIWTVLSLIRAGADINAVDIDKQTPLHFAAIKGDDWIVKILLKNGADRSLLNKNGETALDVAEKMYRSYSFDNYRQTIDLLQENSY